MEGNTRNKNKYQILQYLRGVPIIAVKGQRHSDRYTSLTY